MARRQSTGTDVGFKDGPAVDFKGQIIKRVQYKSIALSACAFALSRKHDKQFKGKVQLQVALGTMIAVQSGGFTAGVSFKEPLENGLSVIQDLRRSISSNKTSFSASERVAEVTAEAAVLFNGMTENDNKGMTSEIFANLALGLLQASAALLPKADHEQTIIISDLNIRHETSLCGWSVASKAATILSGRFPDNFSHVAGNYRWTVKPDKKKQKRIEEEEEEDEQPQPQPQPQPQGRGG